MPICLFSIGTFHKPDILIRRCAAQIAYPRQFADIQIPCLMRGIMAQKRGGNIAASILCGLPMRRSFAPAGKTPKTKDRGRASAPNPPSASLGQGTDPCPDCFSGNKRWRNGPPRCTMIPAQPAAGAAGTGKR